MWLQSEVTGTVQDGRLTHPGPWREQPEYWAGWTSLHIKASPPGGLYRRVADFSHGSLGVPKAQEASSSSQGSHLDLVRYCFHCIKRSHRPADFNEYQESWVFGSCLWRLATTVDGSKIAMTALLSSRPKHSVAYRPLFLPWTPLPTFALQGPQAIATPPSPSSFLTLSS